MGKDDSKEISLNPDKIEEHYNAIMSSSDSRVSSAVNEDTYTNIDVNRSMKSSYSKAIELEGMVKKCLQTDGNNLKRLGNTFIEKDKNISQKIDEFFTE